MESTLKGVQVAKEKKQNWDYFLKKRTLHILTVMNKWDINFDVVLIDLVGIYLEGYGMQSSKFITT